jgi:mono/diheme cytochrome c family protein
VNTRMISLTILVALTGLALWTISWISQRMAAESAPVARGAAYAQVKGCVECHGDPQNPIADANDDDCSDVNQMSWHPDYEVACSDVMAYFETVRLARNFDDRLRLDEGNPLIAGEHLVRQYHCFQCHGHLGQGGFKNDKSFKGYVPGYFGSDFKLLTRNADPQSIRQWITHGMDSAIVETPFTGRIAAFFFKRQAVNMPSYKSLDAEEIEILVIYVMALHQFGPMTAQSIRAYDRQSRLSNDLTSIGNELVTQTAGEIQ